MGAEVQSVCGRMRLRRQRRWGQMEKGLYSDCQEVRTQKDPSTFNPQHKSGEVGFISPALEIRGMKYRTVKSLAPSSCS